MSINNIACHCHNTMDQLLAGIQAHAIELASPMLSSNDAQVIAEELAGYYTLFHEALLGHVEAEEREIYPELKKRLADKYQEPMEALYVEHRRLSEVVTRLGFVLGRALRAECIMCFCEDIIAYTHEVVDLFNTHSVNEHQVFVWAGLDSEF